MFESDREIRQPEKRRNTKILVREALKPFYEKGWDVTEFFLSCKKVNPCIGCETCMESGICAIKGDDMEFLINEFEECDTLF